MIPKYLYKYRNWDDEKHRRILTHNEIFFTSSRNFNDPFDTIVPLRFDLATHEQMKRLLQDHSNQTLDQYFGLLGDDVVTTLIQHVAKNDENFIKSFEADLQEKKFNLYGIFTMSLLCDNILLWSHYANAHKGFCVGFDTSVLGTCFQEYSVAKNLIQIREVEYVDEFPLLNVVEMDYEELVVRHVILKAKDWSYEKEFRAILYKSTNLPYELIPEALTEVIIGARMSEQSRSEIISVLKNRIPRVNLLQAKLKKGAFGLDFERIDY